MALPLGSILRQIEKANPPKKPQLEAPTEELAKIRTEAIAAAKEEVALKSKNVDKALYEHTPEMYQFAPRSEDAKQFLALNKKKRDLYNKALSLQKEDELTKFIRDEEAKGISVKESIKDILSNTSAVGKSFINIEARTNAIENRLSATMHDLRESLRTKWSGLTQDRELGYEVVRYLKDGATKNKQLEAASILNKEPLNKLHIQ